MDGMVKKETILCPCVKGRADDIIEGSEGTQRTDFEEERYASHQV
jgi:hypothetical protein